MPRTIQPRSYDCIVKNWLDHEIYGYDKRYNNQGHHGERIFFSGNRIYSYGTHFEMARILYSGSGKNRQASHVLINGERASVTTSKHQGILRDVIRRHMSNIPSVIIPYGAVEAANIDLDSVKIIHTLNDRRIPIHHEADRPPQNYRVEYPDDDGKWRWVTHRHILGESLISADVQAFKRVTCHRCDGDGMSRSPTPQSTRDTWWSYGELFTRREVPVPYAGEYNQRWNLWTTHDDIIYMLPLPRNFYNCSECRGTGKVRKQYMRRNVKFLSGFDHGEPHLAYFFCELPKCDATTVDEAYEALKPDTVRMAEAMGRDVKRQGDIFAVPSTIDTRRLKKIAKRLGRRNGDDVHRRASMLLGTNHQGTEVIHANDGTIYARGCLWHVPDGRTNDHIRVKLGKQWHIIVKNTVPVRRSN